MAILTGSEKVWSRTGRPGRVGAGGAIRSIFWMMICCCAVQSAVFQGRDQAFREYDVKAVFLYNFTQFVGWPPTAFADDSAPIVIGVLGADPFGKSLEETVRNEVIRNRRLIVQRYARVEEIKTCHILFISQSETGRLDQILPQLKVRSILTVGEGEGFTQRGGMIGFVTEKNKVRLRINLAAAKEGNLIISSKLLRVAEI
ncbi:MAG TPA: YfiR family protein [Blastocatellia bacterium]|nr:YfiR family protein [Blastocatellia bacterium]